VDEAALALLTEITRRQDRLQGQIDGIHEDLEDVPVLIERVGNMIDSYRAWRTAALSVAGALLLLAVGIIIAALIGHPPPGPG